MKINIAKIFLVAATALCTVQSCREDIVDTKPYSSVEIGDAFSSPSLVLNAVNGVYNAMQMGVFNGTEDSAAPRGYVFGAAYFQQNEARGEDVVNTQAFYQITYESNYDPTTPNNVYYWMEAYRAINKANIVIDGIKGAVAKGVLTEAQGNIYLAEVRALRAMSHMELLKHFSYPYQYTAGATHMGVPYRTTAILTPQDLDPAMTVGRLSVAECYNKILEDLNFAEANAQTKAQKTGDEKIVKITKGGVIALKIVAYQNMRNWSAVLSEFAKLQGQYTLEANPMQVFASNYSNNESIFSILNTRNTNPGVNGALASQFNGRSMLAISPILWRNPAWLSDDKRRAETAVVSGAVYTRKYKDITNFSDASPLYRYSEMVLAAAEANARLGNTATALTQLNSVRNRALATPATQGYTAATFASANDLVKAILTERRIELSCEGKRWGDIHRLINDDIAPTAGIPAKVPNGTPPASAYTLGTPYTGPLTAPIPVNDKRFLWPIPLQETQNNPTLASQQNPGY